MKNYLNKYISCSCGYELTKKLTGLPDKAIVHNRKCPVFWEIKIKEYENRKIR